MKIYGVVYSWGDAYGGGDYQIEKLFIDKGKAQKFCNELIKNADQFDKDNYEVEEFDVEE